GPETRATFARAADLFVRLGSDPDFFSAMVGKWAGHFEADELEEAGATAEHVLASALASHHRGATAWARDALGSSVCYMGRFAEALPHLGQASFAFETGEIITGAFSVAVAHSLMFLGATLQSLGFSDAGLKAAKDARQQPWLVSPSLGRAYVSWWLSLI